MIVNVNPYDTGFDENSHVMKFASLAREVTTTRKPAPPAKKGSSLANPTPRPSEQHRRKVTISMGKPGRQSEALLEVLEGENQRYGTPGSLAECLPQRTRRRTTSTIRMRTLN